MNIIKRLFRKTDEKKNVIQNTSNMSALPEEILTIDEIKNALNFYDKHRNHINSLVNNAPKFAPRLNEDKRDCKLWKPGHWNWFLTYYH